MSPTKQPGVAGQPGGDGSGGASTQAAPAVIDFEDLTPGGPGGGGGITVADQYNFVGVRFNEVVAFDYSKGSFAIPGFAHSGTNAVQQCVGQEFCAKPIEVQFLTAPQPRVKLWVGYAQQLRADQTVVLRALDAQGAEVGQATATLPASSAAQPIRTPLEVRLDQAIITRALVSFVPEATASIAGLAVDDVEFDVRGQAPPCTATQAPLLGLTQPADGATVQRNAFLLEGAVVTDARLESATLTASAPGGSHSFDLFGPGQSPGLRDGSSIGPTQIGELLFPGTNTLTLAASNCSGQSQLSRTITFTPIPADEHFVMLGMDIIQNGEVIPGDQPLLANQPTTVRVYLQVTGSAKAITAVGGALEGRRGGVPPARLADLQGPLPPGRLPAAGTITVDDSPDLAAKRQDPNASLNFALPPDWVTPGLVHLSVGPLTIEGADSDLPCEGCENLAQGQPVFLWFRDAWPILETSYINPRFQPTSPTWNSDFVGGKTFSDAPTGVFASALFDQPEPYPRFEWTPILDPGEVDQSVVGASGTAVRPQLSGDDIPFTHPFGFDWEFFVAPDPPYWALLAPSNAGGDEEYTTAAADAHQRGLLQFGVGVLGVETDQDLVPPAYRLLDGDRVAVFGRWIIDAGHSDFHTEIHPPLLIAFARRCSLQAAAINDSTCSWVISRPYLVGQDFGDGAVLKHLAREMLKAFGIQCPWYWPALIPCTTRFEAHPPVRRTPFGGTQQLSYLVRPPTPRRSPADELRVSCHFTVRSGVSVRVAPAGSDAVSVAVRMDERAYQPPPLRHRRDVSLSEGELAVQNSDFEDAVKAIYVFGLTTVGFIQAAAFSAILGRGIVTDRYDAPQAVSAADNQNALLDARIEDLASANPIAVGDDQPFPVYGWLNLSWRR